jgi:hypothetical protein
MGTQDELSIALPLVIADAKMLAREDHAMGKKRSPTEKDGFPRALFIALTKRTPVSLAGTGIRTAPSGNVALGALIRRPINYMQVQDAYEKEWSAAAEPMHQESIPFEPKEPDQPTAVDPSPPLHDFNRDTQIGTRVNRPGQDTFRTAVFDRYQQCGFCNITEPTLLDAAHVVPWCEYGVDEIFNALLLCKLHHRALDNGFILISLDERRTLQPKEGGPTLESLHVEREDISHLVPGPRTDALENLWRRHASRHHERSLSSNRTRPGAGPDIS